LGLIRIPALNRTIRVQPGRDRLGIVANPPPTDPMTAPRDAIAAPWHPLIVFGRSFLIGTFFAAGWSPCVGPVLAGIYGVAGSQPANGGVLLFAYSFGLG